MLTTPNQTAPADVQPPPSIAIHQQNTSISRFLMDRNAPRAEVNSLTPEVPNVAPSPLTSRQDALKALTSPTSGGDGGIFSQLTNNPLFTAGFGLAALGAAVRYGSLGLRHGAALLQRRLLVDTEITRHDPVYDVVLDWMTRHYQQSLHQELRSSKVGVMESLMRRFTPRLRHKQVKSEVIKSHTGAERPIVSKVPGQGTHIMRYRGAFIRVVREREGRTHDVNGRPFETLKFTTLSSQEHVLDAMIDEARQLAVKANEGKTIVYTSRNTAWDVTGPPQPKRPFESVVLDEGLANKIRDDLQGFLAKQSWYIDRGIPRRRGYLLYGPPGTGKTSFVQAIAGALDFNIAMLSLSQRGLTDDLLTHLLLQLPPQTLVLLEDADAAFVNRRQRDADGYAGANVTFSGLLNALDGVTSGQERVIFMTTNHIDRLDDALIRPGRVDLIAHLGHATESQMAQLWERFYGGEMDPDGQGKAAFLQKAREAGLVGMVSTAALQGLFLNHTEDWRAAVENAPSLAAPRPSDARPASATSAMGG